MILTHPIDYPPSQQAARRPANPLDADRLGLSVGHWPLRPIDFLVTPPLRRRVRRVMARIRRKRFAAGGPL